MYREPPRHSADTLRRMVHGWRMVNSKKDLERFHSGMLSIVVLVDSCRFDDMPIGSLSRAGVTAQLSISVIGPRPKATRFNLSCLAKSPTRASGFFRREGDVATAEIIQRSHLEDAEVWPIGWPDA